MRTVSKWKAIRCTPLAVDGFSFVDVRSDCGDQVDSRRYEHAELLTKAQPCCVSLKAPVCSCKAQQALHTPRHAVWLQSGGTSQC